MDRIEYVFVFTLFSIFKRIPFGLAKYVSHVLAFMAQYVLRYRVQLVQENLRRAFPDFSSEEIKKHTREVYINFMYLWVEWLQSHRFDEKFIADHCVIENADILAQAEGEGKGGIFFSGHLGNYELVARHVLHQYGNVTGIMRRVHNPYLNEFTFNLRRSLGFGVIYTDGAFQKGLEILADKGHLGVAGDQDAHEKGVFVDFFGIPSSTPVGTAMFHLKSGSPVIFAAGIREKWGKFRLVYERIPVPEKKDINDDNIYRIMQAATSILEKYIRRYPGQYFWTHRRWKTVPDSIQHEKFLEQRKKYMDKSLID